MRPTVDFHIDLPMKVEEKEPVVAFREFKADKNDLGAHCKELNGVTCFCDRIMTIDVAVPTTNCSKNKTVQPALFLSVFDDYPSEEDEEMFRQSSLLPAH